MEPKKTEEALGAVLVIVFSDDEMVLIQESEQKLDELRRITGDFDMKAYEKWPGGHIEQGETPKNAARREVFEEAGVRIGRWMRKRLKLLAVIERGTHKKYVFGIHFNTIPKLPVRGQNGEKVIVIQNRELEERNLHPEHRAIVDVLIEKYGPKQKGQTAAR